jgi:sugar phosphate isomerase/epimerase
MRIAGTHLGHCTNVHPAETWAEVRAVLACDVEGVRRRACAEGLYGIGLRLSDRASRELDVIELRELLDELRLYVFTLNGFPFGRFGAGEPVKTRVYRPDFREEARIAYTTRLAEILAAVAPPDVVPTISTVPLGFAPDFGPGDDERAARGILRVVASLHRIERATGRRVVLALEPEPWCRLETMLDAVTFFERTLLSLRGELAKALDVSWAEAERILRASVGVCLDACHLAVSFESPSDGLAVLDAAGVLLAKVQLSVGLTLRDVDPRPLLAPLADGIFLHQVVERGRDGALRRYLDLADALTDFDRAPSPREWRVHHHVPIHREHLGESLGTTRAELLSLLRALRGRPLPPLEVETYAFHVLPEEHRAAPLTEEIARELAFVEERLEAS